VRRILIIWKSIFFIGFRLVIYFTNILWSVLPILVCQKNGNTKSNCRKAAQNTLVWKILVKLKSRLWFSCAFLQVKVIYCFRLRWQNLHQLAFNSWIGSENKLNLLISVYWYHIFLHSQTYISEVAVRMIIRIGFIKQKRK